MVTTATRSIVQYGPDSGENHILDKDYSASVDLGIIDKLYSKSAIYNMIYLLAAQNPRARGYQGWLTENKETWSDSPTLDPTRDEDERWSYGRGPDPSTPGNYGNLDQYSGFLVEQKSYNVSSEAAVPSFLTEVYGTVLDKDLTASCEFGIPPLEAESNYVEIYQYPFVLEALPVPYSYKNAVDTNIYLKLSNYTSELDASTVELYVEGEQQTSITITPFYTGSGGLELLWENPSEFTYGNYVEVEWRVDDKSDPPNTIIFKYWFRTVEDTVGPRVISQSPADDATNVSVDSCVVITVSDYESSVDTSSVEMYVNNILVLTADLSTTTNSNGSISFSYCPSDPFLYGDNIAVSFYVEDSFDNYLFHVFNFETEQSISPRSVGKVPSAGLEGVSNETDVELNIVGAGGGVDSKTIVISVDGEEDTPRLDPVVYRDEDE